MIILLFISKFISVFILSVFTNSSPLVHFVYTWQEYISIAMKNSVTCFQLPVSNHLLCQALNKKNVLIDWFTDIFYDTELQ